MNLYWNFPNVATERVNAAEAEKICDHFYRRASVEPMQLFIGIVSAVVISMAFVPFVHFLRPIFGSWANGVAPGLGVPLSGMVTRPFKIAAALPKIWSACGRCEKCGYDLRASPSRCPECGKSVSPLANSGVDK